MANENIYSNSLLIKEGKRQCSSCHKVLPVEAFHMDRHNPEGLRTMCKECIRDKKSAQHRRAKDAMTTYDKLPSAKMLHSRLGSVWGFDWVEEFVSIYREFEEAKDRKSQLKMLEMIAPYIYARRASVATTDENGDTVNFNLSLGDGSSGSVRVSKSDDDPEISQDKIYKELKALTGGKVK